MILELSATCCNSYNNLRFCSFFRCLKMYFWIQYNICMRIYLNTFSSMTFRYVISYLVLCRFVSYCTTYLFFILYLCCLSDNETNVYTFPTVGMRICLYLILCFAKWINPKSSRRKRHRSEGRDGNFRCRVQMW